MIFIVYGIPFSGKRRFGRLLAKELNCTFLSTSMVRNRWIAAPTYLLSEKRAVYLSMLQEVAESMTRKEDLVISGSFYRTEFREDYLELSEVFEIPVLWIHYQCNGAYARRMENNPQIEDRHRIQNKINVSFEPMSESVSHLLISSEEEDELALDKVIAIRHNLFGSESAEQHQH